MVNSLDRQTAGWNGVGLSPATVYPSCSGDFFSDRKHQTRLGGNVSSMLHINASIIQTMVNSDSDDYGMLHKTITCSSICYIPLQVDLYLLWRDVGVCVPFPIKQIKVNNVIYDIMQNIHNINEMMKWLFTMGHFIFRWDQSLRL